MVEPIEWKVPEGFKKADILWVRKMVEDCGMQMRKRGAWYDLTYVWSVR